MVCIEADGSERAAGQSSLPVVFPGRKAAIEFGLEQPLDPVKVRAEVNPNPLDRDPSKDSRVLFLGTPRPQGLACDVVAFTDDPMTLVARLAWSNPFPYEEILLHRDGAPFGSLPGSWTSHAAGLSGLGRHTYEVRGRIEVSRSTRGAVTCDIDVTPSIPEPTFRRAPGPETRGTDPDGRLPPAPHVHLQGETGRLQRPPDPRTHFSPPSTAALMIFSGMGGGPPRSTPSFDREPTVWNCKRMRSTRRPGG